MMHRVIYIDDCYDDRVILERQVARMDGWELAEAASDAEAVRAIDDNSADIILTDMMMSSISGLDVARIAIARGHSVAIVTSYPDGARELLARTDLPEIPIIDKRALHAELLRFAATLDAQPWRRDDHG